MSLFLAQLLLLCGVVSVLIAPVAFVFFGYRFTIHRQSRRAFLMTTFFIAGALAAGFVLWQLLPDTWTLSFAATLKATVDTERYGHAVEHYAEGIVVMLSAGGLFGGSLAAAVAAFLTRHKLAA